MSCIYDVSQNNYPLLKRACCISPKPGIPLHIHRKDGARSVRAFGGGMCTVKRAAAKKARAAAAEGDRRVYVSPGSALVSRTPARPQSVAIKRVRRQDLYLSAFSDFSRVIFGLLWQRPAVKLERALTQE